MEYLPIGLSSGGKMAVGKFSNFGGILAAVRRTEGITMSQGKKAYRKCMLPRKFTKGLYQSEIVPLFLEKTSKAQLE